MLNGRLLALKQDGSLDWSRDINDCPETDTYPTVRGLRTYPVWSSPVIDLSGNVCIAGQDKLYCFSPAGALLWDQSIGGGTLWSSIDTASVDNTGTIYIGGATTSVYAASDFTLLADEQTPANLYAITPQGSTKWTYSGSSGVYGSGIGSNGDIYVQEFGGGYANPAKLIKLNHNDGKVLWEYTFDVFFQGYADLWDSLYIPREKSNIMSTSVAIDGGQFYFTKDHCRRSKL
jgi:hypothetical protein